MDGFEVQMANGPLTLETSNATTEEVAASFIEQLLAMLTNPNIVLLLLTVGVQAILIEICARRLGGGLHRRGLPDTGSLRHGRAADQLVRTDLHPHSLRAIHPRHQSAHPWRTDGSGHRLVHRRRAGIVQLARHSAIPACVRAAGCGRRDVLGVLFAVIVGFAIRALRAPDPFGRESLIGKQE